MTSLIDLRINNAQLAGTFPDLTMPNIRYLYANSNSFAGALPKFPNAGTTIEDIVMNGNDFTGPLPPEW